MKEKITVQEEIIRILTAFYGEPVYKTVTKDRDGAGVAVPVFTMRGRR